MKQKGNAVAFVYIIVGIVVLLGIFAWWHENETMQVPMAVTPVSTIQELPNSELPPAMPAGIVVASDAQVIHSYTATTPAGKAQSALVYTTAKTISDLMNDYVKYFFANNWAMGGSNAIVTSTGKTVTLLSINLSAVKASSTISILISNNKTSTRLVAVNLAQ